MICFIDVMTAEDCFDEILKQNFQQRCAPQILEVIVSGLLNATTTVSNELMKERMEDCALFSDKDVAHRCGHTDLEDFVKVFKRWHGILAGVDSLELRGR
ncbi:hypothetical protein [Verrucomicrobium spinosum]|uniref:hypothetical protein n=1 Tax=Verrucomicrobium spinosum TaxID=2736 RepID=UPI0012E1A3ED|nr:hypothetical protein [Verrucomicrobium spinosum]